ncbi:hypothetical protein J6590_073621 [Homalodisca vitripennis]|nr:hypothetical protein J6590_073621 [Homalodisca vitripennis]
MLNYVLKPHPKQQPATWREHAAPASPCSTGIRCDSVGHFLFDSLAFDYIPTYAVSCSMKDPFPPFALVLCVVLPKSIRGRTKTCCSGYPEIELSAPAKTPAQVTPCEEQLGQMSEKEESAQKNYHWLYSSYRPREEEILSSLLDKPLVPNREYSKPILQSSLYLGVGIKMSKI